MANTLVASRAFVYTNANFEFFAFCSKSQIACWGSPQAPQNATFVAATHSCGMLKYRRRTLSPSVKSVCIKRAAIPATGMILGFGASPQQAIFKIDLQGKFSKIRKLVQVCTACYYYVEFGITAIVLAPREHAAGLLIMPK
jgi:hypothetical protein